MTTSGEGQTALWVCVRVCAHARARVCACVFWCVCVGKPGRGRQMSKQVCVLVCVWVGARVCVISPSPPWSSWTCLAGSKQTRSQARVSAGHTHVRVRAAHTRRVTQGIGGFHPPSQMSTEEGPRRRTRRVVLKKHPPRQMNSNTGECLEGNGHKWTKPS